MFEPPVPPRPEPARIHSRRRACSSACASAGRIRGSGSARCSLAALVAGLVWYQLGVGGVEPPRMREPPATATRASCRSARRAPRELDARPPRSTGRPRRARRRRGRAPGRRARLAPAPGWSTRSRPRAAGCPDADLDRLNLAAKVVDGQRDRGRDWSARRRRSRPAPRPGASGSRRGTSAGPVNLNTATAAQLEELPGIGPSLAARDPRRARQAGRLQGGRRAPGRPRDRRAAVRGPQGPGLGVRRRRPVGRAGGALVAGILAGEARGPGSATGALLVAVALVLLVLALRSCAGGAGFAIAVRRRARCSGARSCSVRCTGSQTSPLQGRGRAAAPGWRWRAPLVDDPSGPRFVVAGPRPARAGSTAARPVAARCCSSAGATSPPGSGC